MQSIITAIIAALFIIVPAYSNSTTGPYYYKYADGSEISFKFKTTPVCPRVICITGTFVLENINAKISNELLGKENVIKIVVVDSPPSTKRQHHGITDIMLVFKGRRGHRYSATVKFLVIDKQKIKIVKSIMPDRKINLDFKTSDK